MKKKLLHLATFVAILAAQPFILSTSALAQAYGESTYGDGVYNDARTDTGGGEQPLSPSDAPAPSRNHPTVSQSDTTTVDDDKEQPDTTNDEPEHTRDVDEVITPISTPAEAEDDSSTEDSSLMKWSLSAIGVALVLVLIGVAIRKSRQE